MPRGGQRKGAGRKSAEIDMRSIHISLRKATIDRLKTESRKRNPENKRLPIGFLIDELVERHLANNKK